MPERAVGTPPTPLLPLRPILWPMLSVGTLTAVGFWKLARATGQRRYFTWTTIYAGAMLAAILGSIGAKSPSLVTLVALLEWIGGTLHSVVAVTAYRRLQLAAAAPTAPAAKVPVSVPAAPAAVTPEETKRPPDGGTAPLVSRREPPEPEIAVPRREDPPTPPHEDRPKPPHEDPPKLRHEWALAIDFGTTATAAVAAVRNGGVWQVEPVRFGDDNRMPSMVFWRTPDREQPGQLLVGSDAEAWAAGAPANLEPTPKRRIGQPTITLGDRTIPVVEAITEILRVAYLGALEQRAGNPPSVICLTHPARWEPDGPELEILAAAARAAGIPEPIFMSEPEAAAIGYAARQLRPGDHVAVFDFGGGTLDTAVLRRTDEGFQLAGMTGGNPFLGGEDFDIALYEFIGALLDPDAWHRLRTSRERSWVLASRDLRVGARKAKERLSTRMQAPVYVPAPVDHSLQVTRDQLNSLIAERIRFGVRLFSETISRAGLQPSQLSAIYLVGGSSYIPLVSTEITQQLGDQPFPERLGDPKLAVAAGAAQAVALRHLDGVEPTLRPHTAEGRVEDESIADLDPPA